MATSSLGTGSLSYNPESVYTGDVYQRQLLGQFIFYTMPASSGSTEYIIIYPNTGSSTHAGKPTTL